MPGEDLLQPPLTGLAGLLHRVLAARGTGLLRVVVCLFGLTLEGRRLLQPQPHVQADQPQGTGNEERQPPAPGHQAVVTEHAREQGHQPGAERVTDEGAEVEPAAEESATSVGGVFGNVCGGSRVFPAGGEPLDQTADQQQNRRGEADGVVGGQESDGESADRHHDHGGGEYAFTADTVAERAEYQAAERPDEKRRGKCGERRDHLGSGGTRREEDLSQGAGQIGIDPEVEPLHGVAQCRRRHRLVHGGPVGDRHILGTQRPFTAAQQNAEHAVGGGSASAGRLPAPAGIRRSLASSAHVIPSTGLNRVPHECLSADQGRANGFIDGSLFPWHPYREKATAPRVAPADSLSASWGGRDGNGCRNPEELVPTSFTGQGPEARGQGPGAA